MRRADGGRGSDDLMFQMLLFRFAPELMVIVPLFVIYNQIGVVRHQGRHDLGAAAGHDAVVVWIVLGFQDLPEDLEQAACWTVTPQSGLPDGRALPMVIWASPAAASWVFEFRVEQCTPPPTSLLTQTPYRHGRDHQVLAAAAR